MNLHLKNPLVFFDLETTGINVVKDRIVEVAFLKVMPNGEKHSFVKRINPEMPIPEHSSKIHGIYDHDLVDAPTFRQIAKNLANFLEGCDLAGYNIIRFDVPILVEAFLRESIDFDVSRRKLIDAQRIFHLMEPRTLSAAYKFYCHQELINAHSAEADNLATFEVLNSQIEYYKDKALVDEHGKETFPIQNDMQVLNDLTNQKMVDFAGRMTYDEKGEIVFNFGKHRSKKVTDILKAEPSYYDWMMKGDFALNTKQKLTEIKLSMLKK